MMWSSLLNFSSSWVCSGKHLPTIHETWSLALQRKPNQTKLLHFHHQNLSFRILILLPPIFLALSYSGRVASAIIHQKLYNMLSYYLAQNFRVPHGFWKCWENSGKLCTLFYRVLFWKWTLFYYAKASSLTCLERGPKKPAIKNDYFYWSVCVQCTYGCLWRPEMSVWSLGVIGSFEMPNVVAENQTWIFCNSSTWS